MDFLLKLKSVIKYSLVKAEDHIVVITILFYVLLQTFTKQIIGVPHSNGPQKLKSISCPVQFNVLVPIDLEKTPFILVSSHGIHSHNAPPPNNTPQMIMDQFLAVVRRQVKAGLTTSKFTVYYQLLNVF